MDLEDTNSKPGLLTKPTREKVDAWCERGILGLVLAVVVWGPLALGAVRPSEFLVLQFLTVGILVLWLVRYWFGKTHRLLWTPLCWPVVGFAAYALVRYATADLEYVARQEWLRVLVYAVLFLAIITNLHRQEPTRIIALTLVGLGTFLALYALYQWLSGSERVWFFLKPRVYFKRASGSYICPDHLAGLLSLLLPVALAYTLIGRFKTVPRVLLGYGALMMLVGLATTVCYAAWVAMGLALAVFFVLLWRQRTSRPAVMVCLAVVVVFGTVFYLFGLKPRAHSLESAAPRYGQTPWVGIWHPAWRMWRDHFWVGVGPAHFDYRYREYRDFSEAQQNRPGRVHNDYLNTLVDWGVVGGALVALALAALYGGVFWGWKYIRRTASDLKVKKSNKSAFVVGASIGLLALLIQSFFEFDMHIPGTAIVMVTLMALVSGHLRFASERFWVTQRRLGTVLGTVLLGTAAVYLTVQGWGLAREQVWLHRAAVAGDAAAKVAALKRAFAVEPKNFETAYAVGEQLRQEASQQGAKGEQLCAEAIAWYERSLALDAYDAYSAMRIGMCLHWLGFPEKADEWFEKALHLDPHSYFMLACAGWHELQRGRYEKARELLDRSLKLKPTDNPFAESCRKQVAEKLSQDRT